MNFIEAGKDYYGTSDGTYSWIIVKRDPNVTTFEASYRRLGDSEHSNIFITEDETLNAGTMLKMVIAGNHPPSPYQFASVEDAKLACERMQLKLMVVH